MNTTPHDNIPALSLEEFLSVYGGIYEHSPWIAQAAYESGADLENVKSLHEAMKRAVAEGRHEQQLALIRAHPDLAGKLELTKESQSEQTGAGLDQCSPEEYEEFQTLNTAYKEKFGFPFIIAVKGHNRQSILENFRARIHNTPEDEFKTALEQINKIAGFRLEALDAK